MANDDTNERASTARFQRARERERALEHRIAALDLDALWAGDLLSSNSKTGAALDFSIPSTCRSTPVCAKLCYAAGGQMVWPDALLKRRRNDELFKRALTDLVVHKLRVEHHALRVQFAAHGAELSFLRWNGSGDLFPEAVDAINELARLEPGLAIWVVTRRPELAAGITPRPNVFIQLSLNASTPPKHFEAAMRLYASHPRTYLSSHSCARRPTRTHAARPSPFPFASPAARRFIIFPVSTAPSTRA